MLLAIRYNTDNNEFEGYGSDGWGSLGGVKNPTGTTQIIATRDDNTTNPDELQMSTNGIERVNINKDGIVNFKNSSAIKIPVGNDTTDKPTGVTGYIRHNTVNNEFEGYGSDSWGSLGGVKNPTGTTKIVATRSDNATNPDEIQVTMGNTRTVTIDANQNIAIGTNQPDSNYKVDITGNTRISENIVINGNTDSTNSSTGSVVISGGVGVAKNLHVDGTITGNLTGNATSSDKSDKLQITSKNDNINYDVPFFNNTAGSYKDVNFSDAKTIKYNPSLGTLSTTNINLAGNLVVAGTVLTVNTDNMTVKDKIIELSSGNTDATNLESGILINRVGNGSPDNRALIWNENNSSFEFIETNSVSTNTSLNRTGHSSVTMDDLIIGGTLKNTTGTADLTLPNATDTLVGRNTADTLVANKTLTEPLVASIKPSNGNLVTLPNVTDTLVGRTTTDILTNKTLNSATLKDPTIKVGLSENVISLPNTTDTLVGRNTTDTLANKTLDNPTITTITPSIGNLITLPDTTDTLVGKNTTDTLANKTLASPLLNNPSINVGTAEEQQIITLPTHSRYISRQKHNRYIIK